MFGFTQRHKVTFKSWSWVCNKLHVCLFSFFTPALIAVKGSLRAPESGSLKSTGSLKAPWAHLEHQKIGSLRAPEVGWEWDYNVHVSAHTHTGTATSSSFLLSCRHKRCGVGWGGIKTSMFLRTHRHSNLIIFPAVMQTQALHFHHRSLWGAVGWFGHRTSFLHGTSWYTKECFYILKQREWW